MIGESDYTKFVKSPPSPSTEMTPRQWCPRVSEQHDVKDLAVTFLRSKEGAGHTVSVAKAMRDLFADKPGAPVVDNPNVEEDEEVLFRPGNGPCMDEFPIITVETAEGKEAS